MLHVITNMLVTGASGIGKSTLLREVARRLEASRVRGFFSDSIWQTAEGQPITSSTGRLLDGRDGAVRVGWRLDAVDGSDGGVVLHPDIPSERRMGRYGMDHALMERIVLAQLTPIDPEVIYVVDELGTESGIWTHAGFEAQVALLDSPARVIAIVRQREDPSEPFLTEVKHRADAFLVTVTLENRDSLVDKLVEWASKPPATPRNRQPGAAAPVPPAPYQQP